MYQSRMGNAACHPPRAGMELGELPLFLPLATTPASLSLMVSPVLSKSLGAGGLRHLDVLNILCARDFFGRGMKPMNSSEQ